VKRGTIVVLRVSDHLSIAQPGRYRFQIPDTKCEASSSIKAADATAVPGEFESAFVIRHRHAREPDRGAKMVDVEVSPRMMTDWIRSAGAAVGSSNAREERQELAPIHVRAAATYN
jgi:hypothetical protein